MNKQEFRQLIREEIKKVLREANALKSGQQVDDYDLTDNGYIKKDDLDAWLELFSDERPFNGPRFVKMANEWLKENGYRFQVSKATAEYRDWETDRKSVV